MQKSSILAAKKPENLTTNHEGAVAYRITAEQALAQLISVGFLDNKYYTSAEEQLEMVKKLCSESSPEFVAACAVYSSEQGMKDMPVVLLGLLRQMSLPLFKQTFPIVIRDGGRLRTFVGALRAGQFGSKNLNTVGMNLIEQWFNSRTPLQVWRQSVGNNPSLSNVMALAHPAPGTDVERQAVYTLLRKNKKTENLPQEIKNYYEFVKDQVNNEMPRAGFMRMKALALTPQNWIKLSDQMSWTELRMNINLLEKNKVLDNPEALAKIVTKLTNPEEVKRSRVFPYQIYTSYENTKHVVLRNALQTALDHSVANVPELPGNVVLAVDVSYSMTAPVNGNTIKNKNSKTPNNPMTCARVAAIMAMAFYKKNPTAKVYTFDSSPVEYTSRLNSHDSIVTNMDKLKFTSGGTDIACTMNAVLGKQQPVDYMIIFSDYENNDQYKEKGGTASALAWKKIKSKNPNARLIMIDLMGARTAQVPIEDKDTLYISGFSDGLFSAVKNWMALQNTDYLREIQRVASSKLGILEVLK